MRGIFFLKKCVRSSFIASLGFCTYMGMYSWLWLYNIISVTQLCLNNNNNNHVVPPAQISLTLSRHFSLSFIASGGSSGLHPVYSHSCCMYVRAGRPAFAWPYAGVHMSTSLLLQQCPPCLARLTCIVFVMGGRWPYRWGLVGCCRQDLFNIARKILKPKHYCIVWNETPQALISMSMH